MHLTKTLYVIAIAHLLTAVSARAEDLCPSGPFETDAHAIAVTIASEPLKPLAWYSAGAVSNTLDEIIDGAISGGGGGFGNAGDESTTWRGQHRERSAVYGCAVVPATRY
jgi:hypothetical protein